MLWMEKLLETLERLAAMCFHETFETRRALRCVALQYRGSLLSSLLGLRTHMFLRVLLLVLFPLPFPF